MTHFNLLVALALASPALSSGNASLTGQCLSGPDGSCQGKDSSALLQGRVRVDDDALPNSDAEVAEPVAVIQQKDSREKETATNAVHDAVGEMEASESSWGALKAYGKQTVKQAVQRIDEKTNGAIKKKVQEAVEQFKEASTEAMKKAVKEKVAKAVKEHGAAALKAVKEEAERIKHIVDTEPKLEPMLKGIYNFSQHCRNVWDKACACAKMDPKKNCQKMSKRVCNGKERETANACWTYIESCSFIWTASQHGEEEASMRMACAGECRVHFGFETVKYTAACSDSIAGQVVEDAAGVLASPTKEEKATGASKSEAKQALLESEEEEVSKLKALDETLETKKSC